MEEHRQLSIGPLMHQIYVIPVKKTQQEVTQYYIIANCFSYIVVISITFFILKKNQAAMDSHNKTVSRDDTIFFNMKNVIEMTTVYEKQLASI